MTETQPKRVIIAGLMHETHSFVPGTTPLRAFRILQGEDVWRADGDASCLAGGLQVARECGWHVLPALNMVAEPSGTVEDAAVEFWWQAFKALVEREGAHGIDGIWLNMHGAMVSTSLPDVEGELLRRIRGLPACASAPIGGVLDLHGNFTALMAEHSNAFISYRKNPHTDGKEAAMDSARLLDRLMRTGERAITVWERPPLVLPPISTGTADQPMRTLEAKARAIEAANDDILSVSVFGGFAFADMPDAGVSFWAVTVGDPAAAQRELGALSQIAMADKGKALPMGVTLDEALDKLSTHLAGPVLLVEPSDNIGGGAPGDLTIVLAGLLSRNVQNAGVMIVDAEAVQHARALPIGARMTLAIGGKSGAVGASPLTCEVELISVSDGKFTLEDLHSHMAVNGKDWDMGPCAVVRGTSPGGSGGVTILLISNRTAPMDLAMWRSQGINPEDFFAINVKAAVAHRQAYDPIATASYTLNTPGPCATDLRLLPYRRLNRPVYPLDEV